MNVFQHTVSKPLSFTGTGLHTGMGIRARILPADPDTGVVFLRTDTNTEIPARVENVVETAYATVLSAGGAKVSTVEHFLAALYGMEIDNARIEVDGPELPILDGSALEISRAIAAAGPARQDLRRKFLRVWENDKIRQNGSMVVLSPGVEMEILVTVDFPASAIGRQWAKVTLTPENFLKEIAPARTFVLREQIDALRAAGLAKGGSLDNAIVVEGDKVHNAGGLRFPNEFARHKLLDFIGDLALLGRPVRGCFLAIRPGHTVNHVVAEYLASPVYSASPESPVSPGKVPVDIQVTA
ncbi:MAG TPA: UDP-3-O-acyl-N-acetylglucosamine deacetylase [Candidatus Limnocylindria bacterium]|nr:UDP-3-O-acyl-N-acetylglucosamine deacetylase [Candidatus Limnocylindria bacterium]